MGWLRELKIFGEFSSLDLWVALEVTAAAWKFGLSGTTIVWYASVVGAVVRARTGSLVGFSFFCFGSLVELFSLLEAWAVVAFFAGVEESFFFWLLFVGCGGRR